jgi:hypothetical protein
MAGRKGGQTKWRHYFWRIFFLVLIVLTEKFEWEDVLKSLFFESVYIYRQKQNVERKQIIPKFDGKKEQTQFFFVLNNRRIERGGSNVERKHERHHIRCKVKKL